MNADTGLRSWRKFAYLGANAARDITPGSRMPFERFAPEVSHDEWMTLDAEASMGRKWSNLFWWSLPWDEYSRRLGPLHMVDIGCGKGGYGPRFAGWAGSALASYRGMDPSPKNQDRWTAISKEEPRCSFVRAGAEDILNILDERTNLIISQSSLEHIHGDLKLIRDISAWAESTGRPVMQIHIVPAAAALPLYLFHGIRQYPLRSLSTLAQVGDGWDVLVFALGGRASLALHWRAVTWPHLILRRKDRRLESWYQEASWNAFQKDCGSHRGPTMFWALMMTSPAR